MSAEVFGFFTYDLSEPFIDFGVVDVVVIDPTFVAGVIGRVDIDAFDFAFVFGQEGFKGFEVIAVDDFVAAIGVFAEGIVLFQHLERHVEVVVDDFVFGYEVEGGHEEIISSKIISNDSFQMRNLL